MKAPRRWEVLKYDPFEFASVEMFRTAFNSLFVALKAYNSKRHTVAWNVSQNTLRNST